MDRHKQGKDSKRYLRGLLPRLEAHAEALDAVLREGSPGLAAAAGDALATYACQLEAGVTLPQACFTLGRFHLLLGEAFECLDSYAKGLHVALSAEAREYAACLETELGGLTRLGIARELFPEGHWARESLVAGVARMLHLGRFLASGGPEHLNALRRLKLADIGARERVLMVAGSCGTDADEEMNQFAPLLHAALEGFEGTVICGGTRAGISGVVGGLASLTSRKFTTLGYHPASLAPDATLDNRYDRLQATSGACFSPLDPLQAWVDVVSAGIAPERVAVLGVGGGPISAFEYRLALALGADVGVVVGSGGAADELLADAAWNAWATALDLMRDPMALRGLVARGQAWESLG